MLVLEFQPNTPPPTGAGTDQQAPPGHHSHSHLALAVGLAVGVFLFILFTAIVIGRFLWKVRRVLRLQAELVRSRPDHMDLEAARRGMEYQPGITELGLPTRYTYLELNYATRGFGSKELLGSGGFGSVYKGYIPPGDTEVAVKKLSESSKQGEREFVAEVSTIGRVRHKNLVQLKGWCYENGKMLLVYEYMPNGSLDKALFDGGSVLGWPQRYKIVKGVAAGLAYLHEGWEKRVLHRDVKPSNVLLDQEFEPRIADFGLARLIEHSKAGKTMTVAGTLGYVAPELHYTGRATDKSDVYSFGILLLAVASGREAMDKRLNADQEKLLLNWVWRIQESGDVLAAVDVRLEDVFDGDEARRVFQLGLLCCFPDPEARPPMRFCEQILHGDASIPNLPSSKPPLFYPLSFSVDLGQDSSFMPSSSSASASTSAPEVISDCTTSELCSSKARSSATSTSSNQQKLPIKRSGSADYVRREDAATDYHMPLIRYRSLKET